MRSQLKGVFVVKICVSFNVLGIVLYSKFLRGALPHTPPGLKPWTQDKNPAPPLAGPDRAWSQELPGVVPAEEDATREFGRLQTAVIEVL